MCDVSTSFFIVCGTLCLCDVIIFACFVFNHYFYHVPFLCPLIYYKMPIFACKFTFIAHIHAPLRTSYHYSCTQVAWRSYDVGLRLTIHLYTHTNVRSNNVWHLLHPFYPSYGNLCVPLCVQLTCACCNIGRTCLCDVVLEVPSIITIILLLHYYYITITLLLLS